MTIDTVTDQTPRVQYTTLVGQVTYAVPFPFYDNTDLVVYAGDTLQTLESTYTVDGAGDPSGGFVTFFSALFHGTVVTIYRETAVERITSFGQNGPILTESLNSEFNHIAFVQQELRDKVNFAIHAPFDDGTEVGDLVLPSPNDRKGLVLSFDPIDGKSLLMVTPGARGPIGETGPAGPTGATGAQGPSGSSGNFLEAIRSTNLTRTSTVTAAADPVLTVSCTAGSYDIEGVFFPSRGANPDTGGFKCYLQVDNIGSPTLSVTAFQFTGAVNGAALLGTRTSSGSGSPQDFATITGTDCIVVRGSIIRDTPFALTFYWCQHTSSVDGTTLQAGSRLYARKII